MYSEQNSCFFRSKLKNKKYINDVKFVKKVNFKCKIKCRTIFFSACCFVLCKCPLFVDWVLKISVILEYNIYFRLRFGLVNSIHTNLMLKICVVCVGRGVWGSLKYLLTG